LHTPASLPPEYQRAFDDHTVQPEDLAADWKFKDGNVNRDDPAFRQYRHERLLYYDRALRLTDDCLMRLFDRLAQTGLLEQSMFVITSDHGEEFWEHVEAEKEFFTDPSTWGIRHGHNLYQEVIHLPCIVWHNCLEAKLKARLQNQLLSHVDLFNLVLHLNGVAGRLPGNDGIGFGDAVSERSCILAEDVAYGFEKKAVVRPPYKLLVCRGDGVSWLFNLEDDPEEQSPLDGPTSVVEELAEALPPAQEEAGRPIRADEDTLNKLRDLGYLE
ncbi:MAG: sulfatase-like hydrolase/transferase, partial [Planctomycetota bacterium]